MASLDTTCPRCGENAMPEPPKARHPYAKCGACKKKSCAVTKTIGTGREVCTYYVKTGPKSAGLTRVVTFRPTQVQDKMLDKEPDKTQAIRQALDSHYGLIKDCRHEK